MIRKTLTILSLVGLLLSVGLWGVSYWNVGYYSYPVSIITFEGCVTLFVISLGVSSVPLYRQRRRRKRKKLGLCLKCEYDLRGSKDRCPECDTSFGMSKY